MKKAFTMIELVFVVIIIGIMSAVLAPRMDDSSLQQGTNQIISHLRLTQHLAMTDNKFSNTNTEWFKERWQIRFMNNATEWRYAIFSDKLIGTSYDGNPTSITEVARDPENVNKYLTGGQGGSSLGINGTRTSKKLNLTKKFGIEDITFSGGCRGRSKRIYFDNIGRPFEGNPKSQTSAYQIGKLITSQCQINLCQINPCPGGSSEDKITIAIEPETGYIHQL